jgi:hypothetical protein
MTTTTAAVIIQDALKENQIIAEGETPSATMYDDGLRLLNRMLDVLSHNNDFAYYASKVTRDLTGEASFTIGPTGDDVSDRPIAIDTATVDRDGITYPVKVIDNQRYDNLTYKALAGANTAAVYYEGTYPNGTVYCYPLATGCTLNMRVLNSVKQFATTATQIDMPPGYEDYLMLALAVRIAPAYGKQPSAMTMQAYKAAKKTVLRTNQVIPTMELPNAVMGKSGSSYAAFMSGE